MIEGCNRLNIHKSPYVNMSNIDYRLFVLNLHGTIFSVSNCIVYLNIKIIRCLKYFFFILQLTSLKTIIWKKRYASITTY